MTSNLENINIAHVMVSHSSTNNEMMALKKFLKLSLSERQGLITERLVEFIDYDGEAIPLLEALKIITEFVKQLRSDGQYFSYLNAS